MAVIPVGQIQIPNSFLSKWQTDGEHRSFEVDHKLKAQEGKASAFRRGDSSLNLWSLYWFWYCASSWLLVWAFCVFSAWALRFMDRWGQDGLRHQVVLDTTLSVPVTHEHRSFQGAAVQPAVSGHRPPTACPARTGCRERKRPEKSS